ncbi:MAG: prolyl oligopeptidase family serine peptidase [Muribaculaceae bacterium]|nr:prolyl oligopeptidase family serine peptidase [Muribaculaceae bacterium]
MTKRLLLPALALCFTLMSAFAELPEKDTITFQGTPRTYRMYIPEGLEKGAPLCLYIHGYSSQGRWVADLNAAADRHGYAICYPDGLPDSKGKESWNVGYPSQYNMADDQPFIRALVAEVCKKYDLDPEEVFCTGSSNGGDIIYQMLYTEPDMFKAYASVAGLTFCNVFLDKRLTMPVPFMEIHGTDDKVSMWGGDPGNTGGWGPYVSVPVAVGAVAANNRCQSYRIEDAPVKPDATHSAKRHIYYDSPYGYDVELYEIVGAPHSWHSKDIDTGEIILSFFDRYRKK